MEELKQLARQYPQLIVPIAEGARGSQLYRDAVLKGLEIDREPEFIGSEEDSYTVERTAVGEIGILCFGSRQDFEHALRALAYRCEPREIPASVGANYIGGLPNWEKVRAHRQAYSGDDWAEEFRRFTRDKANYADSLILLSTGWYSGIRPEEIGLEPEDWKQKSLVIRRNHELTHFIYRKSYPGDVDVIRDEVLADYMGIKAAFGKFEPEYARLFLGIDGDTIPEVARIRHYVKDSSLEEARRYAEFWIGTLTGMG